MRLIFRSIFQVNDGDGGAAAVLSLGVDFRDERMRGKEFGEAAAKSAGAVSVNDAHLRKASERGGIEKFIDASRSFFHGVANDVDFVGGRLVGGSGSDGNAALRSGCGTRRRAGFDAEDVGERNFHAHRAGLNFGEVQMAAAENDGLFHSADANALAFDEQFGFDGFGNFDERAEVGLRSRESFEDSRVGIGARKVFPLARAFCDL